MRATERDEPGDAHQISVSTNRLQRVSEVLMLRARLVICYQEHQDFIVTCPSFDMECARSLIVQKNSICRQ